MQGAMDGFVESSSLPNFQMEYSKKKKSLDL